MKLTKCEAETLFVNLSKITKKYDLKRDEITSIVMSNVDILKSDVL